MPGPSYGLSISCPWNGHNFELLITFLSRCPVNGNESSFVNFLFKLWTWAAAIFDIERVRSKTCGAKDFDKCCFNKCELAFVLVRIIPPHKEFSMLYFKTFVLQKHRRLIFTKCDWRYQWTMKKVCVQQFFDIR